MVEALLAEGLTLEVVFGGILSGFALIVGIRELIANSEKKKCKEEIAELKANHKQAIADLKAGHHEIMADVARRLGDALAAQELAQEEHLTTACRLATKEAECVHKDKEIKRLKAERGRNAASDFDG